MKKKLIIILVFILSLTTEAQVSVVKVTDSLLSQGKYQQALELLKNKEETTANLHKIGSIYQTIGNYTKAIETYKKALKISNNDVIKTRLAKVYTSAGFPSKAIKLYEEIIQKDSSNLLVANSLGKLYLSNGKTKSALKIYKYLTKKDTLNPNYPYQLGVAYNREKKFFEMGDSYLEAFKRDSLHVKSIYRLAKFYKDLKFKDSTLLFIDKGLQIASNNINFNNLKANVSYTFKDYKTSLKHLKRLDSLQYKSVNMYELFGLCYMNFEQYDEAKKSFEKAMELNPRNATILYRLASVYYKTGEKKKAMFTLMRSIYAAKPNLDRQYYLLGTIFKEEGKLKMAITNFKDSYLNNSKNYKALFELATTEDAFYKEKKIAYKDYQKYVENFAKKDAKMTVFAKLRIKEIKEAYFLKGETLD